MSALGILQPPSSLPPDNLDILEDQSTPRLKLRRSVTSMKGLLPLRLSQSHVSLSTQASYQTEGVAAHVDDYFPEILARDLEQAGDFFASRNMTAGAPETTLSSDDKRRARAMAFPIRTTSNSYHHNPGHMRYLDPIEERNSTVFHNADTYRGDALVEDWESMSDTDTSGGMMPPSIPMREQSIKTAATSFTSASCIPSPKDASIPSRSRECSWIIETESDGEERVVPFYEESLDALTPRPPTPLDMNTGVRALEATDLHDNRNAKTGLHQRSHSLAAVASPQSSVRRQLSTRSADVSLRRAMYTNDRRASRSAGKLSASDSFPSQKTINRQSCDRDPGYILKPRVYDRAAEMSNTVHNFAEPSPTSDYYTDSDADSFLPDAPIQTANQEVYIRPSPPPSPMPTVQAWLDNSTQRYVAQLQNDDLAKAVPLPPNVIETLRVSVSCFPETMLLTSSLTVETIRSYSRKLRQPSLTMPKAAAPLSPPGSPRRFWDKVTSYKRVLPDRRWRNSGSSEDDDLQGMGCGDMEVTKVWAPLKRVFGCCSDYICDALYAHIVAYNYISALVPRAPQRGGKGNSRIGTAYNEVSQEDIPRKAASLLGLGSSRNNNNNGPTVNRLALKLSVPFASSSRDCMAAPSPQPGSVAHDTAMRDLRAGLMRCIIRLILTAKMMAEDGAGAERMIETEIREVDPLFTKSLCEIVRVAEEAA